MSECVCPEPDWGPEVDGARHCRRCGVSSRVIKSRPSLMLKVRCCSCWEVYTTSRFNWLRQANSCPHCSDYRSTDISPW